MALIYGNQSVPWDAIKWRQSLQLNSEENEVLQKFKLLISQLFTNLKSESYEIVETSTMKTVIEDSDLMEILDNNKNVTFWIKV